MKCENILKKNLPNWGNLYFPNESSIMHGLKNHSKCKIDQWILIGQNTKIIIGMVSDSTFQLIFKKYCLLSFSVGSNNNWQYFNPKINYNRLNMEVDVRI